MNQASALSDPRSSSPQDLEDGKLPANSFPHPSSQTRSWLASYTPGSHVGDALSSAHSLPLTSGNKTHSQEIRIVHVTDDTVQIHTSSSSEPSLQTTGAPFTHNVPDRRSASAVSSIGPPPPSPPESTEQIQEDEGMGIESRNGHEVSASSSSQPQTPLLPHSPTMRPVTFEEPIQAHKRESSASSQASRHLTKPNVRTSHTLTHRSSVESKSLRSLKSATASSSSRIARSHSNGTSDTPFTDEPLPSPALPSSFYDATTQPPSPKVHSYHRRNTISSATPFPPLTPTRPTPVRMSTMHSFQHSYDSAITGDGDVELGELATDIQHQAEQIRRERISKRIKQAQEAEQAKAVLQHQHEGDNINAHALMRTASLARAFSNRPDEGPLVGNLIGEGHVNYVLMYNMLTGIRVAVSRCQAKIQRPLTPEDFKAANKYSFDIVGNELTPSARYDFKFKDYAPWVFRELRERYFQLDPADYLLSLTAKYILSELGSPGKSGSFFYFSRDYRFIIKTIHHTEHKFLRHILPRYHEHVRQNPHTLLSRFYGLHRVKLPRGRKIHFVIMNNLFPSHKDIHETYDLKGSTIGREYPDAKARENPRAVLKDLNWIKRGKALELGPEKRAFLKEQLRRDSDLLKELHVMDYSLLVGIHNMTRGNRDMVRSKTLKVFSPEVPRLRRNATSFKGPLSPEAIATRRVVCDADPQRLGASTVALPEEDLGDRQHLIFYKDEGGFRATGETNESLDTIYYLGIIDILTPYNTLKQLENLWKGMRAGIDRHKISPVPPTEYADRFFSFMKAVIRGGEGVLHFKAE